MSISYILSQIFTVIMYTLIALSYLAKDRKKIVIISTVSIIFNALAYIFLSAWTGLAMCVIAFLRNLYSIWSESKHKASEKITKRDIAVLIITYLAIIAVTIPTYNGFWSLMSVFGTMAYTYSIWHKNPIVYKFFGIPVGLLWITYNYYVGSFFGVILEVALLVTSIYGFVSALRQGKKPRTKKVTTKTSRRS